jgi:hypothetical protein
MFILTVSVNSNTSQDNGMNPLEQFVLKLIQVNWNHNHVRVPLLQLKVQSAGF